MPQQAHTTAAPDAPPSRKPPEPMVHAYRRDAAEVADLLGVDPAAGLSTADAEQRQTTWGASEPAHPSKPPRAH